MACFQSWLFQALTVYLLVSGTVAIEQPTHQLPHAGNSDWNEASEWREDTFPAREDQPWGELVESWDTSLDATSEAQCDERNDVGSSPFSGCVTLDKMTDELNDILEVAISNTSLGPPGTDKYVSGGIGLMVLQILKLSKPIKKIFRGLNLANVCVGTFTGEEITAGPNGRKYNKKKKKKATKLVEKEISAASTHENSASSAEEEDQSFIQDQSEAVSSSDFATSEAVTSSEVVTSSCRLKSPDNSTVGCTENSGYGEYRYPEETCVVGPDCPGQSRYQNILNACIEGACGYCTSCDNPQNREATAADAEEPWGWGQNPVVGATDSELLGLNGCDHLPLSKRQSWQVIAIAIPTTLLNLIGLCGNPKPGGVVTMCVAISSCMDNDAVKAMSTASFAFALNGDILACMQSHPATSAASGGISQVTGYLTQAVDQIAFGISLTGSFHKTLAVWAGDGLDLRSVDLNANAFVHVSLDLAKLLPAAVKNYLAIEVRATVFGQIADGRLGGTVASYGADCELNIGTRVKTFGLPVAEVWNEGVVVAMPDDGGTILRYDLGNVVRIVSAPERPTIYKSDWKIYKGFRCAQPEAGAQEDVPAATTEIACKLACVEKADAEGCGGFQFETMISTWNDPEDEAKVYKRVDSTTCTLIDGYTTVGLAAAVRTGEVGSGAVCQVNQGTPMPQATTVGNTAYIGTIPAGCILQGGYRYTGQMDGYTGQMDSSNVPNVTNSYQCAHLCAADKLCDTFRYAKSSQLCELSASTNTDMEANSDFSSGACRGLALNGGIGFISLDDWRIGITDPVDGQYFAFSQRNATPVVFTESGEMLTNQSGASCSSGDHYSIWFEWLGVPDLVWGSGLLLLIGLVFLLIALIYFCKYSDIKMKAADGLSKETHSERNEFLSKEDNHEAEVAVHSDDGVSTIKWEITRNKETHQHHEQKWKYSPSSGKWIAVGYEGTLQRTHRVMCFLVTGFIFVIAGLTAIVFWYFKSDHDLYEDHFDYHLTMKWAAVVCLIVALTFLIISIIFMLCTEDDHSFFVGTWKRVDCTETKTESNYTDKHGNYSYHHESHRSRTRTGGHHQYTKIRGYTSMILTLLAFLLLLIGVGLLVFWYLMWGNHQDTDCPLTKDLQMQLDASAQINQMAKTAGTEQMYNSDEQNNITDHTSGAVMGTRNAEMQGENHFWNLDNQVLSHSYGQRPNASSEASQAYWLYIPTASNSTRTLFSNDECGVAYKTDGGSTMVNDTGHLINQTAVHFGVWFNQSNLTLTTELTNVTTNTTNEDGQWLFMAVTIKDNSTTFWVGNLSSPPTKLGSVDVACTSSTTGIGIGSSGAGRLAKAMQWSRILSSTEIESLYNRSMPLWATTDLTANQGFDKYNMWLRQPTTVAVSVKAYDGVLQFGESWRLGLVNGSNGTVLSLSHKSGKTAVAWTSDGETLIAPSDNYTTWNQTEGESHKSIKLGIGQRWLSFGDFWKVGKLYDRKASATLSEDQKVDLAISFTGSVDASEDSNAGASNLTSIDSVEVLKANQRQLDQKVRDAKDAIIKITEEVTKLPPNTTDTSTYSTEAEIAAALAVAEAAHEAAVEAAAEAARVVRGIQTTVFRLSASGNGEFTISDNSEYETADELAWSHASDLAPSDAEEVASATDVTAATPMEEMYYSEETAMDRMTGISKYTQITLAIHLTGKLRFKFADLTKGKLTDLVFDLGAGFVGIITTQSLPGSKAGGLYGTTGTLNVGTRVETRDTKLYPNPEHVVLRGALVTAVYPNQDLVTLSYDDEDDTENPANPTRTNVSAGQVMKCDCNPVLTAGISPGLYITMGHPSTNILTTALKWAIDNVFGILKNFGFISPLSDLAASIMKGITDGLFGASSGDYTTGLFMSTDGVGFMLKNLPPSAFIPITLPLVAGLADAFLPTMSFACTWMSGKSVKCMIDLQGPKWIAMIFEAIGWVVSRVMDTVVGAVKWATYGAKAIAAEIVKFGAAAGKAVQAGLNAVEAGFSELANSVAGLTDALYEGAGRAAVAVAKGADWIYNQFSDFFGDIFGGLGGLFGRRLLGYNWGISWLQLGYDSSLYHPHPLVELLNKQGRHDEALDLSEKLVKINRNLYVHRGKLSEAKPYTEKLLEIQNYRANHSPWNEAASDHTHISPWHDTESDGSWTESDVPWPTDDASDNNAWDQEL